METPGHRPLADVLAPAGVGVQIVGEGVDGRGRAVRAHASALDEKGAGMETKQWYVVCYDITEPKRWRRVYKLLHGSGPRLQYSIFRCRLTARHMERLRWELEK